MRNALCCFFIVVESHPDNMLEDLRLDKPFPELTEHVQDYDLEHMDKKVGMWFAQGFCGNGSWQMTLVPSLI